MVEPEAVLRWRSMPSEARRSVVRAIRASMGLGIIQESDLLWTAAADALEALSTTTGEPAPEQPAGRDDKPARPTAWALEVLRAIFRLDTGHSRPAGGWCLCASCENARARVIDDHVSKKLAPIEAEIKKTDRKADELANQLERTIRRISFALEGLGELEGR